MGIAHHANYLAWFEIGRTDLCRGAGMTYRDIEDRGFLLVVTEVACRYRVPFLYDDEVLIRTTVQEVESRALTFGYELWNAAGDRLHASGFSAHLWLDRKTRKPVRPPGAIAGRFEAYVAR